MSLVAYRAICLKEPWLELILILRKRLETRTRPLFREPGNFVLASSKTYDERAWDDPCVGGLLDDLAKKRAMNGLGKLRGYVHMGGFRDGVPGQDDDAALIDISLGGGKVRSVSEVSQVKRIVEVPTVHIKTIDGEEVTVDGGTQGIFRVPGSLVKFAA